MNELMRDEIYEEIAASFQLCLVHLANRALHDALPNRAERRKAVERLIYVVGRWMDQGSVLAEEGPFFPYLAFAKPGPAADVELEDIEEVYWPTEMFSFAEYVTGNLDRYYDELLERIEMPFPDNEQ